MRTRLVVIAAVLLMAVGAAGWFALDSPRVLPSVWRFLPTSLQTRPVPYAHYAISVMETYAFTSPAVDWVATRASAVARARQGSSIADAHAAVELAIGALRDERSVFVPPAAVPAARGAYGFQVLFPERVVAVVFPKSVAEAAGIRAGDVVETVDALPAVVSPDPRARGHLIRIPGASVALSLLSDGSGARKDVRLQAGAFEPLAATLRPEDGGLVYIELPGTSWPPDFAGSVRGLMPGGANAACGWLVDLRRSSGGNLALLFDLFRPLLGAAPLGAFISATGQASAWGFSEPGKDAGPDGVRTPVAILTSRLTAGAGETAVLAFRGRREGRTRVFGEPSWGLLTGTTDFPLPDGATLQLLTRREADRTGKVQAGPIEPDQPASTNWARFATPDDPAAAAARGWLQAACR